MVLLSVHDMTLFNARWYIGLITISLGCLRFMNVFRQLVIDVSNLLQTMHTCFGSAHLSILSGCRFLRCIRCFVIYFIYIYILAFVTLLVRRLILFKWKSPTPPTHTHWLRDTFLFSNWKRLYSLYGAPLKNLERYGARFSNM